MRSVQPMSMTVSHEYDRVFDTVRQSDIKEHGYSSLLLTLVQHLYFVLVRAVLPYRQSNWSPRSSTVARHEGHTESLGDIDFMVKQILYCTGEP
jgi:hypothetical protein